MADDLCTVEVNGVTVTCACAGCGIAYDHDSGQYTILCCRAIASFETSRDEPTDPSKRHQIEVDLAGATRLEAAQLLQRLAPGKVRIDGSLDSLQKRVTLKASLPLPELVKQLRLQSTSAKTRK